MRSARRLATGLAVAAICAVVAFSWVHRADTGSPDRAAPAAVPPAAPAARSNDPVATPTGLPVASGAAPSSVDTGPLEPPVRAATDTGHAQPVFLSLLPAGSGPVAGRPFKVEIAVESENDFAGAWVALEFEAGSLDVTAVHPGTFMSQGGAVATLRHALDRASGRLTLEIKERPDGPPVSGGGSLATVEFVARRSGKVAIAFGSVEVRDLNDERVPVSRSAPYILSIADQ
jgi:hypothetical protein